MSIEGTGARAMRLRGDDIPGHQRLLKETMPMPDKQKMPADGGGVHKGEPDGVSGMPGTGEEGQVHGRLGGGESAGGAYPNPHTGKSSEASPIAGIGGQSEKAYYGGDNPNATTGGGLVSKDEGELGVSATPTRKVHSLEAGQQKLEIVEDSGIAAAEATGKIGTDAPYEREQEHPGGG